MRSKKLFFNTFFSFINQIVTIICGFILPRFILLNYGSKVNGIVSSITQYLSFIGLMDLGVGAVIQSLYYKPLSEKNRNEVSLLYNASKRFFNRMGYALFLYVIVLCIVFSHMFSKSFSRDYVVFLVLILSFNQFAQFFFLIPDQLLLSADQQIFIQINVQTIVTILNTIIGVVLIQYGRSIHIVKLVSAVIFTAVPIVLGVYVKKYYAIDRKLIHMGYNIEQKWNGIAQHCATVVMNNADVMLLTAMASITQVSVYTVYNLVVTGIKQFINATGNSFTSLLGNLYAQNEQNLLNYWFDMFEWVLHMMITSVFSVTAFLLVPFVLNYTRGIYDVQYEQWIFSNLLVLGQVIFCMRIPYNSMICAAGHYKQTQTSAIMEMSINIIFTAVLIKPFGLSGAAVGTIIAIAYRTISFIRYLNINILKRPIKKILFQISVDVFSIAGIFLVTILARININPSCGYIDWGICAVYYFLIAFFIVILVNAIFFRKNMNFLIRYCYSKIHKEN